MEKPAFRNDSNLPGEPEGTIAPKNLPRANLILGFGILSICLSWWHFAAIAGMATGIVALVLARRESSLYRHDRRSYALGSFNNVRTGRICALLGLAISIMVMVFIALQFTGVLTELPYWGMMH